MVEQLSYLPPPEPKLKKPKTRNLPSLIKKLLSNGPLLNMPVFHNGPNGTGEIMTIKPGPDGESVTLLYENEEQPGLLNSDVVKAVDADHEIKSQTKSFIPTP